MQDEQPYRDHQTERNAGAQMGKARGAVMSKERDAEGFVTACLAGELGEGRRRAAEGAITAAEEHGFVDDAGRVAATLRTYLAEEA